jgi:hypothetical protein
MVIYNQIFEHYRKNVSKLDKIERAKELLRENGYKISNKKNKLS